MKPDHMQDLYEAMPKYLREMEPGNPEFERLWRESVAWKIPNIVSLLPSELRPERVAEVGCFVGHIIGNLPASIGTTLRSGFDINRQAISKARQLYSNVTFFEDDFFSAPHTTDLLVLSDIIEHIDDDIRFLMQCGQSASAIAVNLPLEKCLFTRRVKYGEAHPSGHLRRYSRKDAFRLFEKAGLRVIAHRTTPIVCSPFFWQERAQRDEASVAATVLLRLISISETLAERITGASLFAILEPAR
jgi:hypothetical protein